MQRLLQLSLNLRLVIALHYCVDLVRDERIRALLVVEGGWREAVPPDALQSLLQAGVFGAFGVVQGAPLVVDQGSGIQNVVLQLLVVKKLDPFFNDRALLYRFVSEHFNFNLI